MYAYIAAYLMIDAFNLVLLVARTPVCKECKDFINFVKEMQIVYEIKLKVSSKESIGPVHDFEM